MKHLKEITKEYAEKVTVRVKELALKFKKDNTILEGIQKLEEELKVPEDKRFPQIQREDLNESSGFDNQI